MMSAFVVVVAVGAAPLSDMSTSELLGMAAARYDSMDFDQILPVVDEVLGRDDLSAPHQVEAYRLQAVALAVMNRQVEAEAAFRLLLRVNPDYELPENTSPMVSALFSKVQLEERAISDRLAKHERKKLLAEMAIDGKTPKEGEGGEPLALEFAVKDPRRAVGSVQLRYRRRGDSDFSGLALRLDERGLWAGAIPGEFTANEDGLVLEYYVETLDDEGVTLVGVGKATDPNLIRITPGDTGGAWYQSWVFWTIAGGVAAAAAATTVGVVLATEGPPTAPFGGIQAGFQP